MQLNRERLLGSALFALPLAAGVCASAQAVFLNPQGHGQVLVYPYYTANGSRDTLLTVVNLGVDAKAVKIRFLEGYDSRDVLDLNVYLAAGDVWAATVTADGEGTRLVVSDESCTVPDVQATPQHSIAFTTRAFDGTGPLDTDGGPVGPARTREGHIEVIEMGVVAGDSALALSPAPSNDPDEPEQNWPGGPPVNCARLRDAWADGGYWTQNPTIDLAPPSGGLAGTAAIVNVGLGTVQGYVADALAEFYLADTGREHTAPEVLTPNIASATSLSSLTYPSDHPFRSSFARGIDAVTAVFMSSALYNEFWTTPTLGATSEWVITYPTKRFYTDPHYVGSAAPAPFENVFGADPEAPGRSCSAMYAFFEHDHSAARITNLRELGLPYLASKPRLCFAAQVVTFQQGFATDPLDHTPHLPSSVLASNLVAANFPSSFENGWAGFAFGGFGRDQLSASDGAVFYGQPITGFLAVQFVNGSVQGALANYTLALRHKSAAFCSRDAGGGAVELCQ